MRNRLILHLSVMITLLLIGHPPPNSNTRAPKNDTAQSEQSMTSTWDEQAGELRIYRNGQLVVIYQRDVKQGERSIANAITEIYAVDRPGENLVRDDSPLVPPQILVGVQDELITDPCGNDEDNTSCDYFVHHNPIVEIVQASGTVVCFRVKTTEATQHDDLGTPIAYASDMTISVPYHPKFVIIEYDVQTSLQQSVNVGHAVRPLPFFELINNPYMSVSYLDSDCKDVITDMIPTTGEPFQTFIKQSPACADRPWAAIYYYEKGNLGMILQSWSWSSGVPELIAYTETINHPQKPNLYFQSTDNLRQYDSGTWNGHIIFLAYTTANDYTAVQWLRDNLYRVYLPIVFR